MKRIVYGTGFVLALLLTLTVSCFAQEMTSRDIEHWLEPVLGNWYDMNGKLGMTVQTGSVNGCTILGSPGLGMTEPPCTGTLRIDENGQSRLLKLEIFGNGTHRYLLVDEQQMLRRSPREAHFESVGGIYLGMVKDALLQAYGEPSRQAMEKGQLCWQYAEQGFAVLFKGNVVTGIRLYKGGNARFDQSGLGAADAPSAYAAAYHMASVPPVPRQQDRSFSHFSIGHDEYVFFTTEFVQLTVYDSWLFS